VPAHVIEECWEKIVDECFDFHNSPDLPPGLDLHSFCKGDVNNLRNYLSACDFPKEGNPLQYYRNSKMLDKWCHKALPVARMLLAIPAGESSCERAFSWAHGFITRLRTRTSNTTLEMQMVLYDPL
jgi:hypothetical protein